MGSIVSIVVITTQDVTATSSGIDILLLGWSGVMIVTLLRLLVLGDTLWMSGLAAVAIVTLLRLVAVGITVDENIVVDVGGKNGKSILLSSLQWFDLQQSI